MKLPGGFGCSWVLLLALAACAPAVTSYRSAGEVEQTNETDVRLWAHADKFDEAVQHTDRISTDHDLQAYLQGIVDRLYPDFAGKIHLRVFRDPALNAFALPNGSVYIHTSLLARCDNEAQVATILGHEAAHFVDRHSLRQAEKTRSASAFANVLSLAGIPFVGPLLAVSSILGYSQDLEATADRISYERMLQAGYDTRESVKVFERMAAETANMGIEEPYFFSTHPRMVERVTSIRAMLEKDPPGHGEVGAEAFLQRTAALRVASLEEDLSMNRFKSVIFLLESRTAPPGYPGYYKFFLGEAYRKRGEEGDAERALQAYREAVAAAPEYPPTYRALGLYYLKQKDYAQARGYLEDYLRRAPDAIDREYIRYYLSAIEKGEAL